LIRLFLKFYGVLLATLVFSFVVQMQLMDYVWREFAVRYDFRARFVPTFHLLDEALAGLAPAERAARFEGLARGFGLPARLVPLDALPERARFKPEQAEGFERGNIVALDREGGGFTLVRRLRSGDAAIAMDYYGTDSQRVKMITYVVNWSVEFAIVAVLVFFWVRPFWRDLLTLRGAAEEVGAGRFETRAEVGRHSVLRPLAEAFNAMTQHVASLLQSHRTLTSAVSHELRTPIARLRFSHSLAREEPAAEGKDRFLVRMERDIAEIDELTTELLDYAKLERGAPGLALQSVPAEPWLEDVLADARAVDEVLGRNVEIRADVEVDALSCEPRYMARAVINLLRNALTHARSTVRVSLAHEDHHTVIHVDDDGAGISPSDRERLFEPFVRLDRNRPRDSGGFGLGLAIVRQVARWHGGDAVISDSPLGGTRVSIAW
jgi:two-component system, OmpR family, sensor kinase ParS